MAKNKQQTGAEMVLDIIRKTRGDWGTISPVTRIIPNKKKNRKPKHKGREFDD